jgi:calcineurin-like phosphoesterase family protein
VTTAVVSDLHLAARAKRAIAAEPAARAALLERLAGVDHLVLLGDALELREAPLPDALAVAEPVFRDIGEALGGAPVTIVPGNHDHQLAGPLLDARRLDPASEPMPIDASMPAPAWGPLGRLAGWLGDSELTLAYPGLWIRDDVFATHGHYLDAHNTVPTLERVAVAVTERVIGGLPADRRTPDDYEAALGPLYSLTFSLAQSANRARIPMGAGASLSVWQAAAGANGRRGLGARALSGLVVPAAVGALNRVGLGPFGSGLSGPDLRRAGLAGIATALELLGVRPAHAIFGHTHRSGPWPDDDPGEWKLPGGGSLINSGSWVWEPTFVGDRGSRSPYWPGTCVIVDDEGAPRLERLLEAVPAPS